MRRRDVVTVLATTVTWFVAITADDWANHPHRSWPHRLVVGAVLAAIVGPALAGYRLWRDRHAHRRSDLTEEERQHLRDGTVPTDPDARRGLIAYANQQRYDALPSDGGVLLLLGVAGLLVWWVVSAPSTGRAVVVAIVLPVMAISVGAVRRDETRLERLERQLGLDPGRLESAKTRPRTSAAPADTAPVDDP